MNNYTDEQKKDIEARQLEAIEYLKDKNLKLAYVIGKVELKTAEGESVWADKVQLYLQDSKFTKEETVQAEKVNE